MKKQIAPTYLMGGAAFNFEDAVAAYYLVCLMAARRPLGNAFSSPIQVRWQNVDSGWNLDDLVLVGDTGFETGISIKSSPQLRTTGFERDFVERCWRQFRNEAGRTFNADGDLLCLSVGAISSEVHRAWQLLVSQVRTTSIDRLEKRLENSQSSQIQRAVVRSLIDHAPGLHKPTVSDALVLLMSIRVLYCDFLTIPSQMEDLALQSCQSLLESGTRNDAASLWRELLTISMEYRGTGGDITRDKLVETIRSSHRLAALPDYRAHLDRWVRLSNQRLQTAKWRLSDSLPALERLDVWNTWECALAGQTAVVLAGKSGAGKTSLVNEHSSRSGRRLFLIDSSLIALGGPLHGGELSGANRPLREIIKAERSPSILLVDAIETMSWDGLATACCFISEVQHLMADGHLQVIITCQPNAINRLSAEMSRCGFEAQYVAVPNPSSVEVQGCLQRDSRMAKLCDNDGLVGLLTNLKVLELACRASDSGVVISDQITLKPSALLDFLWSQWIERQGRSIARGRLLQSLGVADARTLAGGQAVRGLEAAEAELVPGLIDDGLLSRFEERLLFAHSFVADLSRLRAILSSDVHEVCSRARSFQWHNAIRLYSQHLAEHGGERWIHVFEQIPLKQNQDLTVCHDLFCDGLIAAAEFDPACLRGQWPRISSLGSRFVALVLDRVALVGTRPDPHWPVEITPEIVAEPGPWRICDGAALFAVLDVVVGGNEVKTEIASSVTSLLDMILRRVVIVGDVPAHIAQHAATLACRFATTLIMEPDRRFDFRGSRDAVYRVMLVAAAVDPEKVRELALTAAKRQARENESSESAVTAAEDNEDSDVYDPFEIGKDHAPPWPDGPFERVDREFRDVCLDSDALVPLIDISPVTAREVILACCIEFPRSTGRRRSGWHDDTGIVERCDTRSALYDVGPFRYFFSRSPDIAIDMLVQLCNFATERWYNSHVRTRLEDADNMWGPKLGPFTMELQLCDGTRSTWLGSANIYRWSLGGLPACTVITTILMAFECWIYEEIDANRDVSGILERVVRDGRTAGLAGCLMDIGKRHPELFLGPLMPLLGCWVFYGWERRIQFERNSIAHEGLIGWGIREAASRREKAVQWHKAKHRKRDILQIARQLFCSNEEFRAYMESCRANWEADFATADAQHGLSHLATVFEWKNYTVRALPDGQQEFIFEPPQAILAEAANELRQASDGERRLTFAFNCRQLLEKGEKLNNAQTHDVFSYLKKLSDAPEEPHDDTGESLLHDPRRRRLDALAGGAALLLRLGDERLSVEMKAVCRQIFEDLIHNPPSPRPLDSPESPGNRSWDYFLADMTIHFIARDGTDELARHGVERCITAFHYEALNHFMKLAWKERARLAGVFELLPGYVLSWSAIREQCARVHSLLHHHERWQERGGQDSDDRLSKLHEEVANLDERFAAFSRCVVECEPAATSWASVVEDSISYLRGLSDRLGFEILGMPEDEPDEPGEHRDIGLDLFVLEHGFDWIGSAEATDSKELAEYQAIVSGLMHVQEQLIPEVTDKRPFGGYGYATKFDAFISNTLAYHIVRYLHADAEPLWSIKLAQVARAPDYTGAFLNMFAAVVHDETPNPRSFVSTWMSMVRYAIGSNDWSPAPPGIPPEQWKALLGMNFGPAAVFGNEFPAVDEAWATEVAAELLSHEGLLNSAFQVALRNRKSASSILKTSCQPIWSQLRISLLRSFSHSLLPYPDRKLPAAELCQFLRVTWEQDGQKVVSDQELDTAFSTLLAKAIDYSDRSAIMLSKRVEQAKSI